MKTTLSSTYRTLLQYMNQNTRRLQEAQLSVASGKKLHKPSDDPVGTGAVIATRSQLQDVDLFIKNGSAALESLKGQGNQLAVADNLLARAIELTVASNDGIYSAFDRAAMATEIRDLKEEVLSVANGQMAGRYFYGGFQDRTVPFITNPAYDPILDPRPVLYNGDYGAVEIEVSPDEKMGVNFTGSAIFLGDADNDGAVDPGKVDIFNVLASLEEALMVNDQAGASAQLDRLYSAQEQINTYIGKSAVAANRLDRTQEEMLDIQVDLKGMLSRYEDVDLAEAITMMAQQEQALQAAMSVTGRISKLSILDYL